MATARPLPFDEGAPDMGGLTQRRMMRELGRDAIFTELGTVGLDISGGRVRESRLQNFKGVSKAKVVREMSETDAIIKGLLSNYTMLAQSADMRVEAPTDSSGDREAAEFIEECLEDMEFTWKDTLSSVFSFLGFGYSWHEQNFKIRQGMNPPDRELVDTKTGETKTVPSPKSKHDDGRIAWWGWPIRLQETIDKWALDENGRIKGVWQRPKDSHHREIFIPFEKSLHFRTSAKRGNPEGESLLECAYRAWFFKRNFEEILGIGVKRDLTGMLVLSAPKEWEIWAAANSNKRQEMEDLAANLQRDEYEGLVKPENVTAELLTAGGERQFDIEKLLRTLWLEIGIATLTDFALIGHEKIGARALKEEAARIFMIALQGLLDNVAETVNRFAIPKLIEMNAFRVSEVPKMKFATVDVPNVEKQVEALVNLAKAGAPIFPNAAVMEAIFGGLRLPIDDLGEGEDDANTEDEIDDEFEGIIGDEDEDDDETP